MAHYDVEAIPDYLSAISSFSFRPKPDGKDILSPPHNTNQTDLISNEASEDDSGEGRPKSICSEASTQTEDESPARANSQNSQFVELDKKIAILKKLEYYARIEEQLNGDKAHDDRLFEEAALFFAPFTDGEQQWKLARLYSVLRMRFRKDLVDGTRRQSQEFAQLAGDLLILASILKGMHRHGVNVPRAVRANLREQKLIEGYLSKVIGYSVGVKWEEEPEIPEWGTQSIRDLHQRWNLIPRLLVVRLWRDIRLLALFIQGNFLEGFRQVEQGGALFFFSHLAWIFFLPRLLTNICLIYKHVFDESSMTEVEVRMECKVRLRAQLVRRWQEIFNDAAWFSSGITTCFFLAGKAPAVGLYLAVAMQSYDLLVMITRFILEMRRLNQIRSDLLQQRLNRSEVDDDEMGLLADLDERITIDRLELFYGIFNFLVLLLCAVLLSPTLAGISPILPIMAATTAVLITLVTYAATQWFTRKRQSLYEGPLISPEIHCIKTMTLDEFNPKSFINAKEIDLGIFSVGYVRVIGSRSDNRLVNLIYVDKRSGTIINFNDAFALTDKERGSLKDIFPAPRAEPWLQVLEVDEHNQLITKLMQLNKQTSVLQTVKKPTLWQNMAKQTTQSVSTFSNGILGIGG